MSLPHQSSTDGQPRLQRTPRMRTRAAASLALALLTIPLATAPAHAAFPSEATAKPCTVTAYKPAFHGKYEKSRKILSYRIKVQCTAGNLKVHMEQQLREADPGKDDYQRNYFTPGGTPLDFRKAGTKYVTTEYPLYDWDSSGREEVYHKVRFNVVGDNGQRSGWVYVQSPELSISAH